MSRLSQRAGFRIGEILVLPLENRIVRASEPIQVEPKVMDVLTCLAECGAPVTREELIASVWGDVIVTDHVLSRCVSELRKALDDDPRTPRYVETIRKKGYRLIPAAVPVADDGPIAGPDATIELPPTARPPATRARAALAFASIAIIAATLWLRGGGDRSADTLLTERPVTSYAGSELDPVLSPDGTRVAFAWSGETGTNFDIHTTALDASAPIRLTTHPGEDKNPAWSPDGKQIAFVRAWIEGSGIWAIAATGGGERQLAETVSGNIPDLIWAPDGTSLIFVDRLSPTGPFAVQRLDLVSLERSNLTTPPPHFFGDRDLALAPDGQTLAFARAELHGVEDLFVARLTRDDSDDAPNAESPPKRLTWDRCSITGIEWTTDGSELLVSSDRAGQTRLWRIAAAGGPYRPVLGFGERASDPDLHADTGRVVYERRTYHIDILRTERGTDGRWSEPRPFLASTRSDSAPTFAPDGERIAFVSYRAGGAEIWLCNKDGRNLRRLTPVGDNYLAILAWSPDGERIAFVHRDAGRRADLFVATVATGAVRQLTDSTHLEVGPSWSRDGNFVYFGSDRSGDWQVWRIAANGDSAPEQMTENGGVAAIESQDGSVFFFRPREDGLFRMVSAGGSTRAERVFDLPDASNPSDFAIASGGLYVRTISPQDGPTRLRFFAFATGRVDEVPGLSLARSAPPLLGFTVSPDASVVLYTMVEASDSDVLMVEGFR